MVQREIDRSSNIHGLFKTVSNNFCIPPRQASRFYHKIRIKVITYVNTFEDANTAILPDQLFEDGSCKRGAKKKWDRVEVSSNIKKLKLCERGNLRKMAANLNIPLSTLHWMKKDERILRPARSYIKPRLTQTNIDWLLEYAWSKVDMDNFYNLRGPLVYDLMYNKKQKYILTKSGFTFSRKEKSSTWRLMKRCLYHTTRWGKTPFCF